MNHIRVVLQARTTSMRLPGKVLLPIAGMPLSVLCSRRLASGGLDLVLATSTDPTDNELAAVVSDHGIPVFRGSLDNVALRFVAALADLDDDDIVVRATSDNPVPDAALINDMLGDFMRVGSSYLGPDSYTTAPYGLCVEIFRLGAFRRAVEAGMSATIAEHVTTAIRSALPARVDNPCRFTIPQLERFRVTVDTLDDYLVAARAFRACANPLASGWSDLVRLFGSADSLRRGEDIEAPFS